MRKAHALRVARTTDLDRHGRQDPARNRGPRRHAAAHRRSARAPEPARPPATLDLGAADAFVWHPDGRRLVPVPKVNRVDMALLRGIDRVRDVLMDNTERFARGLPANNALLWGARGMGKSSLVKASHAAINAAARQGPACSS